MEFAGKTVVVTGAARGIGEGVARMFAAQEARVFLADIADASGIAAELNRQRPGSAEAVRCDVTKPAEVEHLIEQAAGKGALDVLVANAAFSLRDVFFEQPLEDAHRTVDVTMWGTYHAVRSAAKRMVSQPTRGNIVVISSPHAIEPVPRCMAYNMAKAAVDQLARTAAAELIPHGVRVNIVHPGWTDTPGERRFFSEAEIAEQGQALPAGRLARPEEIARAVAFLASDASSYVNGATLTVDGGLRLPRENIV